MRCCHRKSGLYHHSSTFLINNWCLCQALFILISLLPFSPCLYDKILQYCVLATVCWSSFTSEREEPSVAVAPKAGLGPPSGHRTNVYEKGVW